MARKHETRAQFTERKKKLVCALMKYRFEDHMMDILENGDYNSLEELDETIEEELTAYDNNIRMIQDFYNEKILKSEEEET